MRADSPLNLRLPENQPVDLIALMQQKDILGITEKKRTYPSAVQQLIDEHRLSLVDVNEKLDQYPADASAKTRRLSHRIPR
ncbi:MAG: hypothetical protein U5L01_13165 [Rheinheimera sp.]|nr:hypothetical protein [Rheinheimera sp.]